ncbi:MAG: hypothetical protein JXB50_07945 [Spirochaetes bacterium]|nr:hypothetical protein [Spirochaetota bacterium]
MNIVIIPTRIDSSRLPGKAGLKIGVNTLLEYVIAAGRRAKTIDHVVLATTNSPKDVNFIMDYYEDAYVHISNMEDRNDVLGRFVETVEEIEKGLDCEVENIVRLTHDCPLLAFNSYLIDEIMMHHIYNECDFSHNKGNYCSGLDVEAMTKKAMIAINNIANKEEREHVTLAFKNRPDKYKIGTFNSYYAGSDDKTLFRDKWSIDTLEEFNKVSDIIKMYVMKEGDLSGTRYKYTHEFQVR